MIQKKNEMINPKGEEIWKQWNMEYIKNTLK